MDEKDKVNEEGRRERGIALLKGRENAGRERKIFLFSPALK